MSYLILLLLWPFAEIALFSQVASRIGALDTILICVAAAAAGFTLLQWQGVKTLESVRAAMLGNAAPDQDIFAGFCIVMTAMLLIVPGFLSDAFALLLLLPPVKKQLRRILKQRFSVQSSHSTGPGETRHSVIEGEFTRLDDSGKPLLKSPPPSRHSHQQGQS